MATKASRSRQLELSFMVGIFVTDHLIRIHSLFDGDLTAALVLATIANRSLQQYYEDVALKSPEGLDELVEAGAHLPHMRHCNAYSVSCATGIPRETVRRKVQWLSKKGWVTISERGELAIPAGLSKQFSRFDAETVKRFLEVARRGLRLADSPQS
jgi:hypothetical protein